MKSDGKTVIGIDVGGSGKGFHAVALRNRRLEAQHFTAATAVEDWCLEQGAEVVAVDAPCAWASSGSSRLAERALKAGGETIQCFKTPTQTSAKRSAAEGSTFYGWVFNGEKLYKRLIPSAQIKQTFEFSA